MQCYCLVCMNCITVLYHSATLLVKSIFPHYFVNAVFFQKHVRTICYRTSPSNIEKGYKRLYRRLLTNFAALNGSVQSTKSSLKLYKYSCIRLIILIKVYGNVQRRIALLNIKHRTLLFAKVNPCTNAHVFTQLAIG